MQRFENEAGDEPQLSLGKLVAQLARLLREIADRPELGPLKACGGDFVEISRPGKIGWVTAVIDAPGHRSVGNRNDHVPPSLRVFSSAKAMVQSCQQPYKSVIVKRSQG